MAELINTLECPGEFDALAKLRPGEPYFLLIGRDRLAPPLVDQWADRNRRRALADHKHGLISDEQREIELRKSTQAEAIAEAMREYKRGYEAPKVESTLAARPTYTGHQLPEETARRDEEQRARARVVAAVHNAIAEATEAAATLRAGSADPDDEQAQDAQLLIDTVESLGHVTALIAPKRPGIERAQAA